MLFNNLHSFICFPIGPVHLLLFRGDQNNILSRIQIERVVHATVHAPTRNSFISTLHTVCYISKHFFFDV